MANAEKRRPFSAHTKKCIHKFRSCKLTDLVVHLRLHLQTPQTELYTFHCNNTLSLNCCAYARFNWFLDFYSRHKFSNFLGIRFLFWKLRDPLQDLFDDLIILQLCSCCSPCLQISACFSNNKKYNFGRHAFNYLIEQIVKLLLWLNVTCLYRFSDNFYSVVNLLRD